MEDKKTKLIEILAISLGLLIFSGSFVLYVSNLPLHEYIFEMDFEVERTPVAKLTQSRGQIRRKFKNQNSFREVRREATLYNYDTIVSSQDSGARIVFEDGGSIELSPKTMIQLVFEDELSLGGISRSTTINVVSGKIRGRARKNRVVVKTKKKVISVVEETTKIAPIKVSLPEIKPEVPTTTPDTPDAPTDDLAKIEPPQQDPIVEFNPAEKDKALEFFDFGDEPIEPPVLEQVKPVEPAIDPTATKTEDPEPEPSPSPEPSASPTPSPTPTVAEEKPPVRQNLGVRVYEPKNNSVFKIRKGYPRPEFRVNFRWRKEYLKAPMKLEIFYMGREGEKKRELVFEKSYTQPARNFKIRHAIKKPGNYHWLLTVSETPTNDGFKLTRKFRLLSFFEGITALDPLVAGEVGSTNVVKDKVLKDFKVTLRWKRYTGVNNYKLRFYKSQRDRVPIREVNVKGNKFELDRKLFNNNVVYSVSAKTANGFSISSGKVKFQYDFLPPTPVLPANESRITSGDLEKSDNTVLLTWQATNFTQAYLLEVSRSPSFDDLVLKKRTKENFFLVQAPKKGRYYWRVRSIAKGAKSFPSSIFSFSVRSTGSASAQSQ